MHCQWHPSEFQAGRSALDVDQCTTMPVSLFDNDCYTPDACNANVGIGLSILHGTVLAGAQIVNKVVECTKGEWDQFKAIAGGLGMK